MYKKENGLKFLAAIPISLFAIMKRYFQSSSALKVVVLLINNQFSVPIVNGTYAYIESSFPRQQNDTARLISAVIPRNTRPGTCVSFWYHMYGPDIDTLSVYTKTGGSLGSAVWQKKGNQADMWKNGQVFLRMALDYQVS